MTNKLFYGDNLDVLRASVADESVDLIYLDPPFNSNASYNVLFKAPSGAQSPAQIEAFDDTWHWNDSAERAFDDVLKGGCSEAAIMLRAMRSALGDNDMMAYLAMMATRLIELRRVLKQTGTLYLHCDPVASHYLKAVLDGIFERENFVNEISWKRTTTKSDFAQGAKNWPRIHDVLLYYAKDYTKLKTFNQPFTQYDEAYVTQKYSNADKDGRRYMLDNLTAPGAGSRGHPQYELMGVTRYWRYGREKMESLVAQGRVVQPSPGAVPRYKRYLDEVKGIAVGDCWTDISAINSQADERLGYPTQKPLALLERVVAASSNEGDVVLDPFCGCGTTVHAAQKLERQWIGIDVTHLAIALIERRLKQAFPGAAFEIHGVPKDVDAACDLAERDKHEFQKWIVATIEGQPYRGGKKGMDRGIDGYLHFRDADNKSQIAIISVKGGGVKSGDVRDLKGVMEREGAALGVFLTLKEPTREMEREAASAGLYETGGRKFSRLQILTAEQVIEGKRPAVPFGFTESLKKAFREDGDRQWKLL
jgi:site-specific DNA-methyltransferase (adenine-specific)